MASFLPPCNSLFELHLNRFFIILSCCLRSCAAALVSRAQKETAQVDGFPTASLLHRCCPLHPLNLSREPTHGQFGDGYSYPITAFAGQTGMDTFSHPISPSWCHGGIGE
ncbi:hypothetical protein GGR52DRAFT_216635 [Hypoxylon sp. FL1284]|nr:hypothetical protein GGR52DRAFT_216635 [Hypoxylon sp. FL1284]